MGSIDDIKPLPPLSRLRPWSPRLPRRKPARDRTAPEAGRRPADKRNGPGDKRPHIDDYA